MTESVKFNKEILDLTVQGEIEIRIGAINADSVEVNVVLVESDTREDLYLCGLFHMEQKSTLCLTGILSTIQAKLD